MRRFEFLRDPGPELAGSDAVDFLQRLGGPACLFFTGEDSSRTRAFVTLLHGNEPSGVMALRAWLCAGQTPRVNLLCVVASVHAALELPVFTNRMLPRARDLNRCFRPPFEDEQGHLAQEILEILRLHRPEAIVDMHNTSGSGPPFGVCTYLDRQHDALVSRFTRRLMVSQLSLGALMEISDHQCPTVTIEVGGRLDQAAHELAVQGLARYAMDDTVLAGEDAVEWGLEILRDPIRVELNAGVTLAYGDQPRPGHDITLRADIEHHNFGVVHPDTALGWVAGDAQRLLRARDALGRCALAALLECREGVLYPARDLKLFMITTNAVIAQSDCLFYAVADDGAPIIPLMPADCE